MISNFIYKKDGYNFYFYNKILDEFEELEPKVVDIFISVMQYFGFNKRGVSNDERLVRYRGVKTSKGVYSSNYADKLFMLGEKSNSHIKGNVLASFNLDTPERQLKDFIIRKNGEIDEYVRKRRELRGEFSLDTSSLSKEELVDVAVFLERVIHNIGKSTSHENSNFVSVSKNCSTAKKFATSRLKKDEKGLIYVMYEIPIYYRHAVIESTSALNKMLLNRGVEWFEDIHEELTLRFGILPHSLLGYIDINEKRFVVNHWLVDQMRGEYFEIHNIISGINVDQSDFLYYFSSSSYKAMTRFTNSNVKHINSSS